MKRRLSKADLQKALYRLETGREFLQANKWVRGAQKERVDAGEAVVPEYGYCAYGALRYCDSRRTGLDNAVKILAATVKGHSDPLAVAQDPYDGVDNGDIFEFNDAKAKNKKAVVGMFDAAIKHVKKALGTDAQAEPQEA